MNNDQNEIRRVADGLRSSMNRGAISAAQARSALADRVNGSDAHRESVEQGHDGTLHMCPWHTCAATRHG